MREYCSHNKPTNYCSECNTKDVFIHTDCGVLKLEDEIARRTGHAVKSLIKDWGTAIPDDKELLSRLCQLYATVTKASIL